MATSSSERTTQAGWVGRALIYALIYIVVGVVFAQLASHATFFGARFWRLAAWLVSAIAFGAHIQYERVTSGGTTFFTRVHASSAAALGALGLAVTAVASRHAV